MTWQTFHGATEQYESEPGDYRSVTLENADGEKYESKTVPNGINDKMVRVAVSLLEDDELPKEYRAEKAYPTDGETVWVDVNFRQEADIQKVRKAPIGSDAPSIEQGYIMAQER